MPSCSVVVPSSRTRLLSAPRSWIKGKFGMRSPQARRQRLRVYIFFLAFALALSVLAVTKSLPYASFLVENTDAGVAASEPSHGFSVGSVRWEVEQFSTAPSLTPFRHYFRAECGRE